MSYRFELDVVVLRFYIYVLTCVRTRIYVCSKRIGDQSQLRSFVDASERVRAKYCRERVHRARYYERRWSLRKNVTSRYDKSPTCHAQIQFYEARSPRRMEVHRQRRGTPRNTVPVFGHDGGG